MLPGPWRAPPALRAQTGAPASLHPGARVESLPGAGLLSPPGARGFALFLMIKRLWTGPPRPEGTESTTYLLSD